MYKLTIPYKSHGNKYIWDYMTQLCTQLNNINLADSLDCNEAKVDNIIYLIIDNFNHSLSMFVALSRCNDVKSTYSPFNIAISTLNDVKFDDTEELKNIQVFSFDVKKYNSVLSFSESYQNRDNISLYFDSKNGKIYYNVLSNNIDLSPIAVSANKVNEIVEYYFKYRDYAKSTINSKFIVDSVDKNSYLLPFMSYKDFLNFTVYSSQNTSEIVKQEDQDQLYFCNILDDNDDLKFFSSCILRKDKFHVSENASFPIQVPTGLWQLLVVLQHFKSWKKLELDSSNNYAKLILSDAYISNEDSSDCEIIHIFNEEEELSSKSYKFDNFQLVGRIHSDELFKLNKLYSSANRTCFFDFSSQTFTGNNYVFNDDKLALKTVELEDKIDAKLPLKITFTEIKHYIGSDLSQKNFKLYIYTDGIRVMLERWSDTTNDCGCRIVFNHTMSKKNQGL